MQEYFNVVWDMVTYNKNMYLAFLFLAHSS